MSEAPEEKVKSLSEEIPKDHPYKVLIVDDNPVNVKVIDIRLKKLGVETMCLTDSSQAIETIKNGDFDLILLDVVMPQVSGLDILKWVRERYSAMRLPVIMVTAKIENQDLIEAMQIGANDFITKPIDFQIAWARIDTHITIKRFNDEVERQRTESLKAASMGILIDMAGSVAHEINNPLTIAIGRIQLVQMKMAKVENLDEESKNKFDKEFETIYDAMIRAESVVSGLRAFAQDERKKDVKPLNLKETILMTFNVCRTTITAAGVKIIGDSDIDGSLKILGKQSMLIQVFYNLFKNSKEAIMSEEEPWIKVECQDKGDTIDVVLTDSGQGIDTDTQDKMFEAFFTTKGSGTSGMGLTNSSDTLAEVEGSIRYNPESSNTQFIVTLKKAA
jgi:two-component system sensor histidine kinase/response regulator